MITYEEFIKKYNIRLNDAQMDAVKSVDGANLLLAVPGSGKTTVLITRLGYMIYCCGIEPENILVITYTVAATKEMKERFVKLFGNEYADRIEFRTINGICAKIINEYSKTYRKRVPTLISTESIILGIISKIYSDIYGEYPEEAAAKSIRLMIAYIKNMMLTKYDIESLVEDYDIAEIYARYKTYMQKNNKMDFDDQMIYARRIFLKCPNLLSYYQNKYKYLCVDEAQDTSKIQHDIIHMLAQSSNNIFMVGDEDQSIYGFRAAYPEALINFGKTYTDANIILMEENYRSSGKIIAASNNVIKNNSVRYDKTIHASREQGDAVRIINIDDRYAQYEKLVDIISHATNETAILYRANESVIPLVDLLDRKGIAYRIKSKEMDFFKNVVIADIKAFLSLAYNRKDTDAFMRLYYKTIKYLSKKNAEEICKHAKKYDEDVFTAADNCSSLPFYMVKNIAALERMCNQLKQMKPQVAIDCISHLDYYKAHKIGTAKVDILQMIAKNTSTSKELLKRLQELENIIEKATPNNSNIILSTIHSSKGLEYDSVYIIDYIDGIFPSTIPNTLSELSSLLLNEDETQDDQIKEFEEERRIFYVGITRAKNHLTLFNMVEDGKSKSCFCKETIA